MMPKKIFFFLMLFFAGLLLCGQALSLQITNIDTEKMPKKWERIVITTTDWTKVKNSYDPDNNSIILSFEGLDQKKQIKFFPLKSQQVKEAQIVKKDGEKVDIIINCNGPVQYEVINVFGKDKILVEIGPSEKDIPLGTQMTFAKKAQKATTPKSFKKPVKIESLPADGQGPKFELYRPGKHSLDEKDKPAAAHKEPAKNKITKGLKGKIIVIDPGHGGNMPGATSISGHFEKYYTLFTAKILAKILRQQGAIVYMTRTQDIEVPFRTIVNYANSKNADLFIGIHYNSIMNPRIGGTETYYYRSDSRRLAIVMHRALTNQLKRSDRGINRAKLYVINHTDMPAIIVEPLYISNLKEENLARSEAYQKKIASAILYGIKRYFGVK